MATPRAKYYVEPEAPPRVATLIRVGTIKLRVVSFLNTKLRLHLLVST